MPLVLTAILPVVLLLTLGSVLRHLVLPADCWRGLEKLTYYVFTPALFVGSTASADLSAVPLPAFAVAVATPVVVVALLVLVLRRPLRITGPALTSLLQGSIRINTYVGLVFASTLHGGPGVAVFALATAILVPLVNIICVSVLAAYGERARTAPRRGVWRELATNPLILSCAVGLALNASGLGMPDVLGSLLDTVAAPALACGTLIAGAAVVLRTRREDIAPIAVASVLKLVAVPAGAGLVASLAAITGMAHDVVLIICAVPTAPSAAVLAARLGGDTRLMASITGTQTFLALATVPLVLHGFS